MTIHASGARGSGAKLGIATGAAATVGNIKGVASGTNSENGAGELNSAAVEYGAASVLVNAGSAYGATAKAGAGTLGYLYGKATATAGNAIATGTVGTTAYGLFGDNLSAGNAGSLYALGIATGAASSIGALTGEAYATSTGSTTAAAQISNATATGIHDLSVAAGEAGSLYKAYAGASSVGAITGAATPPPRALPRKPWRRESILRPSVCRTPPVVRSQNRRRSPRLERLPRSPAQAPPARMAQTART